MLLQERFFGFVWPQLPHGLQGHGPLSISPQYGFTQTFLFQAPAGPMMSLGAWMGTIMLFNVWVLIWPNQKKVLGIVEASVQMTLLKPSLQQLWPQEPM